MTGLLARILLAIIMFPLAAMVYVITFFLMERGIRPDYVFGWSGVATAFFVAVLACPLAPVSPMVRRPPVGYSPRGSWRGRPGGNHRCPRGQGAALWF